MLSTFFYTVYSLIIGFNIRVSCWHLTTRYSVLTPWQQTGTLPQRETQLRSKKPKTQGEVSWTPTACLDCAAVISQEGQLGSANTCTSTWGYETYKNLILTWDTHAHRSVIPLKPLIGIVKKCWSSHYIGTCQGVGYAHIWKHEICASVGTCVFDECQIVMAGRLGKISRYCGVFPICCD